MNLLDALTWFDGRWLFVVVVLIFVPMMIGWANKP